METKQFIRYTWRIDSELNKKLTLIAERELRTINKHLILIVSDYIAKYEYKNALSFENGHYISKLN